MLNVENLKKAASLSKIKLTDEELANYDEEISKIYKDIEKIKEVKTTAGFFLSSFDDLGKLRSDKEIDNLDKELMMKNIKSKKGSFVKTVVMVNE